jgi:hypothetical protein
MLNYQLSNFLLVPFWDSTGFPGNAGQARTRLHVGHLGDLEFWPLEFWGIDVECNLQKKLDIVKSVPETVMHHFVFFGYFLGLLYIVPESCYPTIGGIGGAF